MSKHSELAPSGAHRWLNCTASINSAKGISSKESKYSLEGSKAHELAESLINQKGIINFNGYNFDSMYKYVKTYIEYVDLYRKSENCWLYECEYETHIPTINGVGTIDSLAMISDQIHIIDLKYGVSRVKPDKNPQLMLYASGVLDTFESIFDVSSIHLHIVQPRINKAGYFKEWVLGPSELNYWIDTCVAPVVKKIKAGVNTYNSGEWCQFCPIKDTCIEIIKKDFVGKEIQDEDIT